MLLVDSSALVLANRGAIVLLDYASRDEIVVCPSVVQEMLQGSAGPREVEDWLRAFTFIPILDVPLPIKRFYEAAFLYRACRDAGFTIRKSADCLIAACAIAHDATLLHDDRDYDHLAKVTSLRAVRA